MLRPVLTLALALALALLACVLAGCSEDGAASQPDGSLPVAEDGATLYSQPFEDGNTFACATCHALDEPAPDDLRRPGHPIGDAARRKSFKNGQLGELRDAVNSCLTEWMVAEPLDADDARWAALESFLVAEAGPADAPAITFDVVAPPADLAGGDLSDGMQTFNQTCAVCHGPDAVGSERAPSLVGARLSSELIAERIRLSGRSDSAVYEGLTGGVMPFWSRQRLSDEELLDLVAYVHDIGQQEPMLVDGGSGMGGAGGSGGMGGSGASGCASTHPLVGQTADFVPFAHNVGGTVRVVDDCTLRLENFTFDGGGIDVQVYGGRDGNFDEPVGFSMSEDLLGQVFDGDTLTVSIPAGKSLDDLNSVSIWCLAVGQTFGDATFR